MYQKSNEQAQQASEIPDTNNECENPEKCPAHEVVYLIHTYWVNISSFCLENLLFI